MKQEVFKKALPLYRITEQHLLDRLSGGTYNAVYEFDKGKERFVIRIGELEFDQETTDGMIAWLKYLSENRAAFPKHRT